jgi:8-oxo-dGTP pyrophosphatase MutT (NUDIX family)
MASIPESIRQTAAIPIKSGQICLVSSRSGKRWVIPKGMIDPGRTAAEMALQEAWEEAGLVGVLAPDPVGTYFYEKWGGIYHVTVFVMQVTDIAEHWPECEFRQRSWVTPTQALLRIDDRGLREVIRGALTPHSLAEPRILASGSR